MSGETGQLMARKRRAEGGEVNVKRRRVKKRRTRERKKVNWEKLKRDAEIRDRLPSDSSEEDCERRRLDRSTCQ